MGNRTPATRILIGFIIWIASKAKALLFAPFKMFREDIIALTIPIVFISLISFSAYTPNQFLKNRSSIDLSQKDFRYSDFTTKALWKADFSDSNLFSANFANSNLEEATFKNNDLRGAIFEKANLTKVKFDNVNLLNANFDWAVLDNADFSKAQNIDPKQFKISCLAAIDLPPVFPDIKEFENIEFRTCPERQDVYLIIRDLDLGKNLQEAINQVPNNN